MNVVLIYFIFFLSGTSALLFETLWFQLASLSFGNSMWASTIVLSSFMGGLAFGNGLSASFGTKIKFPIRFYAYIEWIIAVSGCALVLVFPYFNDLLTPVFRPFLNKPEILNPIRLFISFFIMLIPSTAMGATLPVLVKAMFAIDNNFGKILGKLYGWNTLGAVFGALSGELFLIEWLGIRGTGFVAAGINLLSGLIAYLISKNSENHKKIDAFSNFNKASGTNFRGDKGIVYRLLFAGFLSGFVILALEVIWFRLLLLFYNAFSLNFAIMLSVILTGISLGGLAASWLFRRPVDPRKWLVSLSLINGVLIIVSVPYLWVARELLSSLCPNIEVLPASMFLMFPVSLVSGMLFTFLGKALHEQIPEEGKATGLLTLSNTIGAMLGAAISGFLLIPVLEIEGAILLLASVYCVVSLLVLDKKHLIRNRLILVINCGAMAALIIALTVFPSGIVNTAFLQYSRNPFMSWGEYPVLIRQGPTETLQYLRKDIFQEPYYYRLLTNSHSMSSTDVKSRRYMKQYVYLPLAVHPEPKNALLVCYGVGSTAKALTDTDELQLIDIVDISKDVFDFSKVIYPEPADDPTLDPRVNLHVEDGRFFLQTTQNTYDIITGEPPPPHLAGMVNLYSQEYFQLIHDCLSEYGIVTYWLPVYQLTDQQTKSILRGFCNVFEECSLWTGAGLEWMMVGTRKVERHPVSEEKFEAVWKNPRRKWELEALGFNSPESLGATFIADGRRLKKWISDAVPLVDNYPKRLLSRKQNTRNYIAEYMEFMNSEEVGINFLSSPHIEKLWPESIKERTAENFSAQRPINAVLSAQHLTDLVKYFHGHLGDPDIMNAAFWLLMSDFHFSGEIVNRHKNEEMDGNGEFLYMALNAIREKDIEKALYFFELAQKKTKITYHPLRIYLMLFTGKTSEAFDLSKQYLQIVSDNERLLALNFLKWVFGVYKRPRDYQRLTSEYQNAGNKES
jgi:spermidine synthase